MSKFDWFVIGLVCGPLLWALCRSAWAIFKNAFAKWAVGKFK